MKDRIPYTYLLHFRPSNQFYYGVRWAKGCHPDEFWTTYFTSSSRIMLLRTLFGDEVFEFEIRRRFGSISDARQWESKVLRRLHVVRKPDIWLNRTDNTAILNDPSKSKEIAQKRWLTMTEEAKKNFLSHRISPTDIRVRLAHEGANSHWYGVHLVGKLNGNFGKKHPGLNAGNNNPQFGNRGCKCPNHGSKWITNGIEAKHWFPGDVIPDGWRLGRPRKADCGGKL
jgi:hypothetical protein